MLQAAHYDAIVIGTSHRGRLLPLAFAEPGWNLALIERDQLGACVNARYTLTKTMVARALTPFDA